MQMIRVSSKAINAIGYDPQTKVLKITFKKGKVYRFCHVPQSVFDGLTKTYSKGAYYNRHIKGKYRY